MGICCAVALIGDTKQATSDGKSGLVETELTRLAATALYIQYQVFRYGIVLQNQTDSHTKSKNLLLCENIVMNIIVYKNEIAEIN